VESVPDSRNFKLKRQVELTTVLNKELDSTTDEVEFWQEKYEEAMKTIRKLKRHYPQGMQTLSEEEAEEFYHTRFLRPKPDAHRMYAQDQVVIHTVRM
jgi:Glu-tRNA(Gln) amidotransferase subunit E-like FAD-binding protein